MILFSDWKGESRFKYSGYFPIKTIFNHITTTVVLVDQL